MTPPVLPTPSLGNLATDISGAAAGFIKGLQAEKERRRQEALEQALLQVKAMQALKPELRGVTINTPEGLRFGTQNLDTGTVTPSPSNVAAPNSNFFGVGQTPTGDLTQYSIPRTTPVGQTPQAAPVTLPPGQQPRDVRPSPFAVETPTGPQIQAINPRTATSRTITGPSGQPVQPRAQQFEVEKGQFAANMSRAAQGMERVYTNAPQAVDEAVQRLNFQGVLQSLPVIGAPAGEVAQRAIALGLSPEASEWLANFYTFMGFAVPELAGKQMTITEMRQQVAMFAPLVGEPDSGRRVKLENIRFRVESAMRAAGPGMTRVGVPETPPAHTPQPPVINPRFDPRRPQ
jgi:hypothetical protein